jgi:hypothetical protein
MIIAIRWVLSTCSWRNNRTCAVEEKFLADAVGIISLVGE